MATPTIGNQDFRGYLNYLGQHGDQQAKDAVGFYRTGFVDNNGNINTGLLNQYAQGANTSPAQEAAQRDSIQKYISTAYNTYRNNQGSVLGESTGGAATGPSNSQAIANVEAAINRLPAQQNSGYGSIDSSYQDALKQLLLSRNTGKLAYDSSKSQAANDYISAKNTIGANAGSTLNGLQRLLGSRGAGGSSAYNIAAPQAVARAATAQRQDVGQTFGANSQSLDTNWQNFLTDYNNQVSSAGSQRRDQRQKLEQDTASNKATLLKSLASLQGSPAASQPYFDQANSILDHLSSYASTPINYQTEAYKAPSLASYTTNPSTPTYQGQAPSNDYFSPYLGALLGKKQPIGA